MTCDFFHHVAEEVAVFGNVDRVDACTKDVYAVFLKFAGNVKWSLSTKLNDNSEWLFLFVNLKNVFCSNWLEVELVRSIIVSRNCLRVTVYNVKELDFSKE